MSTNKDTVFKVLWNADDVVMVHENENDFDHCFTPLQYNMSRCTHYTNAEYNTVITMEIA